MFKLSSTSDVNWLTNELIKTGHLDAARAFAIGLYAGSIDKEEFDRLFDLINKEKLRQLYDTPHQRRVNAEWDAYWRSKNGQDNTRKACC